MNNRLIIPLTHHSIFVDVIEELLKTMYKLDIFEELEHPPSIYDVQIALYKRLEKEYEERAGGRARLYDPNELPEPHDVISMVKESWGGLCR